MKKKRKEVNIIKIRYKLGDFRFSVSRVKSIRYRKVRF